jgi:hypothetical protein
MFFIYINDKIYSVKINMDHLEEIAKVSSINIAALAISLSNLEGFLRVAGVAAALIYTCMKIIQLAKHWND